MNRALIVIVGILMVALLLRDVVNKLISGKLMAGGGKVFGRGGNPILYWSTVTLEISVALILSCTVLLELLSRPIP